MADVNITVQTTPPANLSVQQGNFLGLGDGSVTAQKLAATLDLSGKTLTLPNGVVSTSKIDPAGLDASALNWAGITDWQPSTAYAKGALVSYLGVAYRRAVAGTSGTTFNTANWQQITPSTTIPSNDSVDNSKVAGGSLAADRLNSEAQKRLAKAWVNFDGRFTAVTGKAYTRSGTTVTVTSTAHGLATGNTVVVSAATDTALNGSRIITVTDANTFTFPTTATGANGTLTYTLTMRGSINVASVTRNGLGDFTVTFSTSMTDASYAFSFAASPNSGASQQLISQAQGSIRFTTNNSAVNNTAYDPVVASVTIFGN